MTTDDSSKIKLESNIPKPTEKALSEHDTLKYHLLGPSLTKAGQDAVDQTKVSEIIYNSSKGSKFFNNEENKDKVLTSKIERILARKRQLEKLDLSTDQRRADEYIAELELGRDLSQTVVHIDCDAFYAAVEELDRPELKDVPFAVGKGVLTTCNYHARKFGCRSAMAGFVALKLCPQLITVPLNFAKYTAKATEVREVLADYDPNFESASIDEAYLNITQYCQDHEMAAEEAVSRMRAEVHEKCKITISAGIAANAKLAKICSNKNKPNGQYRLPSERTAILGFMRDLPTRKVNGVGRVFERELDAIGVKTCGDLYEHRAYLAKLFGTKAFHFLMQCYLGLGRTSIAPPDESHRKSVGTESTFRDISDKTELRAKLKWIAEELEKDLTRTCFKGRTLCLKIKLYTYEVMTRQVVLPKAVGCSEDLYTFALPMLTKLEREIPGMRLRLMGLRCTHLVSTKKTGMKDFFGMRRTDSTDSAVGNDNLHSASAVDDSGWEIWPEQDFEEAARQEKQEEMEEMERLSQESPLQDNSVQTSGLQSKVEEEEEPPLDSVAGQLRQAREGNAFNPKTNMNPRQVTPSPAKKKAEDVLFCPICGIAQPKDDRALNDHIDVCLSRQTIREVVNQTSPPLASDGSKDWKVGGSNVKRHDAGANETRGRKRKGVGGTGTVVAGRNKKLFFG